MVKLIDAQENANYVQQHGRMSLAKHSMAVSALEKRALRYHGKGQEVVDKDKALFNEAIAETSTVLTEGLTESDDISQGTKIAIAQATHLENEEINGVSDDLLTIYGITPGSKTEGVTILIYENPDGFKMRTSDNDKLEKAK